MQCKSGSYSVASPASEWRPKSPGLTPASVAILARVHHRLLEKEYRVDHEESAGQPAGTHPNAYGELASLHSLPPGYRKADPVLSWRQFARHLSVIQAKIRDRRLF